MDKLKCQSCGLERTDEEWMADLIAGDLFKCPGCVSVSFSLKYLLESKVGFTKVVEHTLKVLGEGHTDHLKIISHLNEIIRKLKKDIIEFHDKQKRVEGELVGLNRKQKIFKRYMKISQKNYYDLLDWFFDTPADVDKFKEGAKPVYMCVGCGWIGEESDMYSDSCFNGEDEDYSDHVCPGCNNWSLGVDEYEVVYE